MTAAPKLVWNEGPCPHTHQTDEEFYACTWFDGYYKEEN